MMEVYSAPSCSREYYDFIETKNAQEILCFCCLSQNVPVINIRSCNHNEFIKQYTAMDFPEFFICASCHQMLKKIEAFKQQIYVNYLMFVHGKPKSNNLDYRLTVSPLSRTEVTVSTFSVIKTEVNPIEVMVTKDEQQFHEIEVPAIKVEFESDIDCDTQLPACLTTETIDNPSPTVRLKSKKAKRQKNANHRREKPTDNSEQVDKTLTIEKLENKYIGKIAMLILSMEELMKEREKKRLDETYSKMVYKCDLCIKGFKYDYTYNNHNKKNHNMKPGLFCCEICKSVFTTQVACSKHNKRHFKRYVCLVCNKMHMDLESTVEHYNMCHQDREPIEICLKCSKCDYVASSSRKFRYHMEIHRGGQICEKCNKIFGTQTSYNDHIILCHKKTKTIFKCENCPKTYRHKSGLYMHTQVAHSTGNVKGAYCATCNIQFKTENNYEMHLKKAASHATLNSYRFICDLCKEKFRSKTSLELHMLREHLKLRNFKCQDCGKMLFTKGSLNKHIKDVHRKRIRPKNKMCDFCGKGFQSIQILRNHIRTHTGERPLNCPFCEATFAHNGALYTHKKLVHKVQPQKCVNSV